MLKAEKLLDWDIQTQYLLKLINIARVTILFSFLIFLIAINSLRVPITHLSFAPLIQNQSWLVMSVKFLWMPSADHISTAKAISIKISSDA